MTNNVKLFDTYGILYIGTNKFFFDIEDLHVVQSRTNWYVDKGGYLTSCYYYAGALRIVRFHRIVMHAAEGNMLTTEIVRETTTENKISGVAVTQRIIEIEGYVLPTHLGIPASLLIREETSGRQALP